MCLGQTGREIQNSPGTHLSLDSTVDKTYLNCCFSLLLFSCLDLAFIHPHNLPSEPTSDLLLLQKDSTLQFAFPHVTLSGLRETAVASFPAPFILLSYLYVQYSHPFQLPEFQSCWNLLYIAVVILLQKEKQVQKNEIKKGQRKEGRMEASLA